MSDTPAAQTPAPTIPCDRFRWPAGPDRRADAWEAHLASIYAVTVARDADRSAGIGLTTDNFGPVPLGSVSAVAYAAGFSSESAFCRAFHRRFGIRPRETGLSEALSGMGRETRPALLSLDGDPGGLIHAPFDRSPHPPSRRDRAGSGPTPAVEDTRR